IRRLERVFAISIVRFSKELFGNANRFVRENAPEANPSVAIHKQTHLRILGRDTTNKGGGRFDRRLESFCRLRSSGNFRDIIRKNAKQAEKD
ncbi:MAG: hypothetical protein DMF26_14780, partial [Verrucomicrobia bacterium]